MRTNQNNSLTKSQPHTDLNQRANQRFVRLAMDQHHITRRHIVMVMLPELATMRGTILWPTRSASLCDVQERPASHNGDLLPFVLDFPP